MNNIFAYEQGNYKVALELYTKYINELETSTNNSTVWHYMLVVIVLLVSNSFEFFVEQYLIAQQS